MEKIRRAIKEFDEARRNLQLEFSELEKICCSCPLIVQNCDSGCEVGKFKRKIAETLYGGRV